MTSWLRLSLSTLALTGCGLAPALAQDATNVRIRGTIAAVEGSALMIAVPDHAAKIMLRVLPTARIVAAVKASFVDITPGTHVGLANTGPNGLQDALEIHIFPNNMQDGDDGQTPWDLGRHSRMTKGLAGTKAESYDGQNLTVTYNGGESTIQVRPNTPVVRFVAGTRADLKTGATVFINGATSRADGSMETNDIVVGRDGAKPAM